MENVSRGDSAAGNFPATRVSVIDDLGNSSPEIRSRALEMLMAAYWMPAYKYVLFKYRRSQEDAQDLTQGFFARVLEKNFLTGYDSRKARFRTYFRLCLDRHISNEMQSQVRFKRGGGTESLSLDFACAETEMHKANPSLQMTPEEYFEKEWVRSIFDLAIKNLRAKAVSSGKEVQFRIFEEYDVEAHDAGERLTYGCLAARHGLSASDVTNYLAEMRRLFREEVLRVLRDLTANEGEFRLEARSILGIEIK